MTTKTDTNPCIEAGEHLLTQRHHLGECPTSGLETEEGQGLGLALQLMAANQAGLNATMDALWEGERRHRQALEVLIDVFLEHADHAYMGTVREYEDAINIIRFKGKSAPHINLDFNGSNWIERLSALHPENQEQM